MSQHSRTLELLGSVLHNVRQVVVCKNTVQALVVHSNQLVDPVDCKRRHLLCIVVGHLVEVHLLQHKVNVRHKLLGLGVSDHFPVAEGVVQQSKEARKDTLEPASVLWVDIDALFVDEMVRQVQRQLVCSDIQTVLCWSLLQSLQEMVGVWQLCVVEKCDGWLRTGDGAAGRAGETSEAGEVREVEHLCFL